MNSPVDDLDLEEHVMLIKNERDDLRRQLKIANEKIQNLQKTLSGSYALMDGSIGGEQGHDSEINHLDILDQFFTSAETTFDVLCSTGLSSILAPFRSSSTVNKISGGCLCLPALEEEEGLP